MLRKYFVVVSILLAAFSVQGQQKPLTNADILKMVKAGVAESTIILAIQGSPADYDVSTDGLISLSANKVPAAVQDAMVKAQRGGGPTASGPTNQVSKGAFQEMNSATAISSTVSFVHNGQRIALKRMIPNTKTNSGKMMIPYAGIFMKAKSYLVFNGNRSDIRIDNNLPEFEVGIASDVKASDAVGIVKLETEKQTRKTKMLEVGAFGGKSGTSEKFIMRITIEEVPGSTANGITVYRIRPDGTLKPGEYAIVVNAGLYYDFGVDAIR